MQVLARSEQVLLESGGGRKELLARVSGTEGAWLCRTKELHCKLCSSISRQTWHKHCQEEGERTVRWICMFSEQATLCLCAYFNHMLLAGE